MHNHVTNVFRDDLRRALRKAGYSHPDAMQIVEKAQRLVSDIHNVPEKFFDVARSLQTLAAKYKTSVEVARFLVMDRTESLFEASGVPTWKDEKEAPEKALLTNEPPAPPRVLPAPNGRIITVPGWTPPEPEKPQPQARTPRRNSAMGRKPKPVPADSEIAAIAKKLHDASNRWPAMSDGAKGLPEGSAAWSTIFANIRDRKTTLAHIVHASYPEVEITAAGRFKIAAPKKIAARMAKEILSDDRLAECAVAYHKIHGHMPRMSSGRECLPANSYAWSRILPACSVERGKTISALVRDYLKEKRLPPLDKNKPAGRKAAPVPEPKILIGHIDAFRRAEKRFPGMADAKQHLPENFPLKWPRLILRIRKDHGMTFREFYKAHKINPFSFNIAASPLTPRTRYFRDRLQDAVAPLKLPPAHAASLVAQATDLFDDRVVAPDAFFNMTRNLNIIARQNLTDAKGALTAVLKKPALLFELHELQTAKKQDAAPSDDNVIAATLRKVIDRNAGKLQPDLMDRLVMSYNAFNSAADIPRRLADDEAARMMKSLQSFVMSGEAQKVKKAEAPAAPKVKRTRASGKIMPSDDILWQSMDACRREEGVLPTMKHQNKYLPGDSKAWPSIYFHLRARGLTFRMFYKENRPGDFAPMQGPALPEKLNNLAPTY